MGFANMRSGNVVESSNHRKKHRIGHSNTDAAYGCINATTEWDHVSFFLESKKIFDSSTLVYICLHSSNDLSTLIYTCLVTRLHSSTFVRDSPTFV